MAAAVQPNSLRNSQKKSKQNLRNKWPPHPVQIYLSKEIVCIPRHWWFLHWWTFSFSPSLRRCGILIECGESMRNQEGRRKGRNGLLNFDHRSASMSKLRIRSNFRISVLHYSGEMFRDKSVFVSARGNSVEFNSAKRDVFWPIKADKQDSRGQGHRDGQDHDLWSWSSRSPLVISIFWVI